METKAEPIVEALAETGAIPEARSAVEPVVETVAVPIAMSVVADVEVQKSIVTEEDAVDHKKIENSS